jgi:hypothetical protein
MKERPHGRETSPDRQAESARASEKDRHRPEWKAERADRGAAEAAARQRLLKQRSSSLVYERCSRRGARDRVLTPCPLSPSLRSGQALRERGNDLRFPSPAGRGDKRGEDRSSRAWVLGAS